MGAAEPAGTPTVIHFRLTRDVTAPGCAGGAVTSFCLASGASHVWSLVLVRGECGFSLVIADSRFVLRIEHYYYSGVTLVLLLSCDLIFIVDNHFTGRFGSFLITIRQHLHRKQLGHPRTSTIANIVWLLLEPA